MWALCAMAVWPDCKFKRFHWEAWSSWICFSSFRILIKRVHFGTKSVPTNLSASASTIPTSSINQINQSINDSWFNGFVYFQDSDIDPLQYLTDGEVQKYVCTSSLIQNGLVSSCFNPRLMACGGWSCGAGFPSGSLPCISDSGILKYSHLF